MKKFIAVALIAVIVASVICFSAGVLTSAAAEISYAFSGTHQNDRGWAQGTITVTAGASDGGTYYLYWADDNAVLDGYDPIAKLAVPASGSKSFTMPQYTAIPADATKVAGYLTNEEPANKAVSAAKAVYNIPTSKTIGWKSADKLYSFASYSDFHISEGGYGLTNYPYDNEHEKSAWSVAAKRKVDFVVTTGDHINNQREDSNGGNNPYIAQEWQTYLKNLAESDYTGPVYEAIGNHELWNYDTESSYRNMDWQTGSKAFVMATGLDSTASSVNSGKAYFEITEPNTGDHFLFMALEGGFYTDRVDEFTDAQLTWLENKLKAYQNDGHNIFILEHSNFYKWGSGDQLDRPIYDIPLKDTNPSTVKLKNILKTYKSPIFLCGHTHFKFDLQLNYSDNNGTSATMIHNSSVGAVRNILYGTQRENDKTLANTEGYIVEVYPGATIFYGINLNRDKIMPSATYIVNTEGSLPDPFKPTEKPTDPPTEPPTEKPTDPPTEPPTEKPTEKPTAPPTEEPTDPPTELPTEEPTMPPREPDYFLVGSFTDWTVDPTFALTRNENEDGAVEYVITTKLYAGDEVKVVKNDREVWYPDGDGNNYVAPYDGRYTIYCRPNGDGHSDWIKNQSGQSVLYVVVPVKPTDKPTERPTEKATEKPTAKPTEKATEKPIEKPVLYGDVDLDGFVKILDATMIQKQLASMIELTDEQIAAAKVDGTDKLNILDATLIQKKLASLIDKFPVEEKLAKSSADFEIVESGIEAELAEASADLNTLRSQAQTALSKYFVLASYDQYQALKKAYRENADYNTLNTAYNNFNTAVTSFYGSSNITVYFTNNKNWSNVYAYCWDGKNPSTGHSNVKNATWPGQKCTYVTTNGYGEKIYSFTVERDKFNYIIFTDGSSQTVDVPLINIQNRGYYISNNSSPYQVKFYEYK